MVTSSVIHIATHATNLTYSQSKAGGFRETEDSKWQLKDLEPKTSNETRRLVVGSKMTKFTDKVG
jgi:hypothetical protein